MDLGLPSLSMGMFFSQADVVPVQPEENEEDDK